MAGDPKVSRGESYISKMEAGSWQQKGPYCLRLTVLCTVCCALKGMGGYVHTCRLVWEAPISHLVYSVCLHTQCVHVRRLCHRHLPNPWSPCLHLVTLSNPGVRAAGLRWTRTGCPVYIKNLGSSVTMSLDNVSSLSFVYKRGSGKLFLNT